MGAHSPCINAQVARRRCCAEFNCKGHRPNQSPLGAASSGQTTRSTIIFLISAIALAGFNPFGQVLAQFMIVWQR